MRNTFLFCGLFVLAAASCKKEDEQSTTCRVSRVEELYGSDARLIEATYDALGRPIVVVRNGVRRMFTYAGKTVRIETDFSLDSVVLNDAGQVLMWYRFNSGSPGGSVLEFVYRGAEVQYSISRSINDPLTDTVFYEWADGDLVARRFDNGRYIERYEYYPDKAVVDNSDRERISSLLNTGGYVVTSRHLRKSSGEGVYKQTSSYDLDPNGRVLIERNDKGVFYGEYRYTYDCR